VIALLINTVLPWDFFFAYLAARLKDGITGVLPQWLEIWVELEALNALANFAYLNPDYNFPVVADDFDGVFSTRLIGHPLIPKEQVVCNDFRVDDLGGIAIITGSNMAGKSTFLKTVGINLCLAYAGAPAYAENLQIRPLRLHTCMKISDSIIDGYSYFYAEVRCLKKLQLKVQLKDEYPVLYLVDEIFRGTNNRERLIGSRAYIRAMIGENASGLIATHDLELANLTDESPNIVNYHFRDEVRENRLAFDYRIHPGPSPTTNALRIMQMEGLPVDDESSKS
jgi:DNA mismatch repair ATPase MutS